MTCNSRKKREGVGGGVLDVAAEATLSAFRISKRGTKWKSWWISGRAGLIVGGCALLCVATARVQPNELNALAMPISIAPYLVDA
jgi:hypothetical protein